MEAREGEAHGRGLGMDAVAATDADGHLVLEGAPLQRGQQRVEIGQQDVGGAGELDVERRVEHVGRGHALMDEARLVRPHDLGQMREEGDHVVLRHRLDLVDAGDVEGRVLRAPDGLGVRLRDRAERGHRVAGMGLDLEPDAELRLGRPDGDHLGAGIAGDHGRPAFRELRCARGRLRQG
jgi:hypothetical protein